MRQAGAIPRRKAGQAVFGLPIFSFGTLALTLLLAAAVDRPATSWVHGMVHAGGAVPGLLPFFIGLTHLVDPVPPLAAVGFLAGGLLYLRPGRHGDGAIGLVAASLATLVTITIKNDLKFAFGRLWPETWVGDNPSWIANAAYGFVPFHGGAGWSSFPSGHMAIITAPMAALMLAWPSWRIVLSVPVAPVAIGLFGADYHFLSDIVAGTWLGAACTRLVWGLLMRAVDTAPRESA